MLLFILSVPADWGYTGVVIILVFDYYYGSWKHQAFAYCMVVMLDMGVLSLLIHPFFGLFYDHVFQIDWELYAYSVEYVGAFLPLLRDLFTMKGYQVLTAATGEQRWSSALRPRT